MKKKVADTFVVVVLLAFHFLTQIDYGVAHGKSCDGTK